MSDVMQTPNEVTDVRQRAAGNLAFLLSVIRCGEQLSPDEEAVIRKTITLLNESTAEAAYQQPAREIADNVATQLLAGDQGASGAAPQWQPIASDERFSDWLSRQIQAAHAQYEKAPKHRKQRAWDQFLLLKGVEAEYFRRQPLSPAPAHGSQEA